MRDIKFRAWNKIDNVMYYGIQHGIKFDDGSEYSFADFLNNKGYHEWVIEQFTGLKDKNGVEIYEGDIYTCSIGGYKQEGTLLIADLRSFYESLDTMDSYMRIDESSIEIIGNIHENPELLKD